MFVSTRTSPCSGPLTPPTADIYLTQHHPVHGWLEPKPLCGVNSTADEFSPSFVEADGVTMLYFSSSRAGFHKIYVSVLHEDGTWGTPSARGRAEPGGAIDARPNVRKDGLEIVFDSTRGDPANVNSDIFTSTRTSLSEPWSAPQRLGANVNSADAGIATLPLAGRHAAVLRLDPCERNHRWLGSRYFRLHTLGARE